MKQPRLLPALLLALLMLLPAGCGTQTTGAPQQTPTPTETATVSGAAGTLRVQVPDGWKYEICPEGTLDGSEACFGVKIWPDSNSGQLCAAVLVEQLRRVRHGAEGRIADARRRQRLRPGIMTATKTGPSSAIREKTAASLPGPTRTLRGSRRRVSRWLAMLDTVEWEPAA